MSEVRAGGTGPVWVHVAGDLDIYSAPRLALLLRQSEWWPLVILDLRNLSFMDSAGVHVIVDASSRQQRLVLIRGPAQVDRMFTVSGVADRLTIVDLDRPEPPQLGMVPRQLDGGCIPAVGSGSSLTRARDASLARE